MNESDLWDLKDVSQEPALKSCEEKIRSFRDKHVGERCFIIGNGPSLNRTDLSLIAGEHTFGMNKIFLNFGKMGFVPTYYVAVNPYVIQQSREEISEIPVPKFISHAGIPHLPEREDILFVRELPRESFSTDIARGWRIRGTVTFCAMQLAYYMGFAQVILVGVDHHYISEGEPNRLVTSHSPDPDHFNPDYFGPGTQWQLPDLKSSETSYRTARNVFEWENRIILDATVGGHLKIFPKVSLESVTRTGVAITREQGNIVIKSSKGIQRIAEPNPAPEKSGDFLDFARSPVSADLIIFGAGQGGKELAGYIHQMNSEYGRKISIKFFLDNDPKKWGIELCGKKICRPEAAGITAKDMIVIASMWHEDIREQLLGMGLDPARIFCYLT